jgi:hypothetical protein
VLAALVVTGCGSSSSDARPRHASTTAPATSIARSTATVDQEAADKAEITATFQGWGALVADYYAEKNQWDENRSRIFITGKFLESARSGVKSWQALGKRTREPKHSIAHSEIDIESIDGRVAQVSECQVNDLIVESKNGSILDDRVGTYRLEWRATKVGSDWKISELVSSKLTVGQKACES